MSLLRSPCRIHPRWKIGKGYLTRKPCSSIEATSKDVLLMSQNDVAGRDDRRGADTAVGEHIEELLSVQVDDVFRCPVPE